MRLPWDQTFFEMNIKDWEKVTQLNMNGMVYPSYGFLFLVMVYPGFAPIISIFDMISEEFPGQLLNPDLFI